MLATLDITALNNHRDVLAIHLGISSELECELAAIEFVDFYEGVVYRFKHNNRTYAVALSSIGIPSDCTVKFKEDTWSITSKQFAKIIRIRTPSSLNYGHYVGQYVAYYGNSYHGFYFHLEDKTEMYIDHFYYQYVNSSHVWLYGKVCAA